MIEAMFFIATMFFIAASFFINVLFMSAQPSYHNISVAVHSLL